MITIQQEVKYLLQKMLIVEIMYYTVTLIADGNGNGTELFYTMQILIL